MTAGVNHRLLMAAVVSGWALVLMPLMGETAQGAWLDQLAELVQYHKELTKGHAQEGTYAPYLEQLAMVRAALDRGDHVGAHVAVNRFMDMLEAREGGISRRAANALWQYCYEVTPPVFHDVHRHLAQTDLLSNASEQR